MCNTCLPCVTGDEYTTDVYQPLYTVQQKKKVYQFLRCAYINTYFFFFIFLHRSLYWSLHCWLHVYYGLYRIKSWNLPCEKLIGEKYRYLSSSHFQHQWCLNGLSLINTYTASRRYVLLLLYKYFFIRILNKFWIHLTVMIEYVNKEYNSSQQLA